MTFDPHHYSLELLQQMYGEAIGRIIEAKSGEGLTMEDKATFAELTLKHATFLATLHKRGTIELEKSMDLILAHAEAERQVNEWLDIVGHPKTTKAKRTRTLKLLEKCAEEYKWITEQRQKLDEKLQKAGRVKVR